MATQTLSVDIRDSYESKYGFKTQTKSAFETDIGLFEKTIHEISDVKKEPEWLRKFRLESYSHFLKRKLPTWGADLSGIDFGDIVYYAKPTNAQENSWDEVPSEIKNTFEKLGIPDAERKFLAGVGAQFECLSGDTKVFTNPRGPVEIASIKPNDCVFSLNEQTKILEKHRVKNVASKGVRKVYEVGIGTRKIKATQNHPFLALVFEKMNIRRRIRIGWKFLNELIVGDLVAVVKDFPDFGKAHSLTVKKERMFTGSRASIFQGWGLRAFPRISLKFSF